MIYTYRPSRTQPGYDIVLLCNTYNAIAYQKTRFKAEAQVGRLNRGESKIIKPTKAPDLKLPFPKSRIVAFAAYRLLRYGQKANFMKRRAKSLGIGQYTLEASIRQIGECYE